MRDKEIKELDFERASMMYRFSCSWRTAWGGRKLHCFIRLSSGALGSKGTTLCGKQLGEHRRDAWSNIGRPKCVACERKYKILEARVH